jgi:hypothetical protein
VKHVLHCVSRGQSLEQELTTKLPGAWIGRGCYLTKVSIGKSRVDPVELRMVECVIRLEPKLDSRTLCGRYTKLFEQAQIPVEKTRAHNGILARRAEALIGSSIPRSDRS